MHAFDWDGNDFAQVLDSHHDQTEEKQVLQHIVNDP